MLNDETTNSQIYSVAHSKKGWTDGVIGRLWIEDLDKKTCEKANGCTRLLLVDGHNSHYTMEFLDYARQHNIHVLCYPAHSTHVYQGLDIVIFGPLKRCWGDERKEYEGSKCQQITKQTFVSIYGCAHHKTLRPELVRTAFEKTGLWPFNPCVVTKEMMAPSLETSSKGHLPLPQPSPVRAILALMRQYQSCSGQLEHTPDKVETSRAASKSDCAHIEGRKAPTLLDANQAGQGSPHQPLLDSAARDAVETLASTSVSFLIDETPLTSSDHLPRYTPSSLTPTCKHKHPFLDEEPRMEKEHAYRVALRESYDREAEYKGLLFGMQSTVVL